MIKKALIFTLAFAFCFLTACGGGSQEAPAPEPSEIPESTGVLQNEPSEQPSASTPANSDETSAPAAPVSEADFVLTLPGGIITFDQNITQATALLGEDYQYAEAISCAYDGLDKTFSYDGIEIITYPDGEQDFVNEIILTSGGYSTSRGTCVGDSLSELTAAYGPDYKASGALVEYELGTSVLSFTIKDDVVVTIDFFR